MGRVNFHKDFRDRYRGRDGFSLSMPLLQFQKSLRMLTGSQVAISTRRGLVPKCVPRLYLRSLLGTRRSAQFFSPLRSNIP